MEFESTTTEFRSDALPDWAITKKKKVSRFLCCTFTHILNFKWEKSKLICAFNFIFYLFFNYSLKICYFHFYIPLYIHIIYTHIYILYTHLHTYIYIYMKIWKYEKGTGESCRIQSNLMNDEELKSFNFLKLKYKRGDQIIQPFCRIGSPQEIRSHLFNFKNFSNYEKCTTESCGINQI